MVVGGEGKGGDEWGRVGKEGMGVVCGRRQTNKRIEYERSQIEQEHTRERERERETKHTFLPGNNEEEKVGGRKGGRKRGREGGRRDNLTTPPPTFLHLILPEGPKQMRKMYINE